jgi:hypothetical protein
LAPHHTSFPRACPAGAHGSTLGGVRRLCLTDTCVSLYSATVSRPTNLFEKHGIVSGFAFLSVHVFLGVDDGSVVQPADGTSWPYTAPTATTFEAQAGIKMPALLPALPLAATQMIPASAALLHASDAAESSQSLPAQTQRQDEDRHHQRRKVGRRQVVPNDSTGSVNRKWLHHYPCLSAKGTHCCMCHWPCPICAKVYKEY